MYLNSKTWNIVDRLEHDIHHRSMLPYASSSTLKIAVQLPRPILSRSQTPLRILVGKNYAASIGWTDRHPSASTLGLVEVIG
jgi:hypothetical protein